MDGLYSTKFGSIVGLGHCRCMSHGCL